jgi:hypothetical protein
MATPDVGVASVMLAVGWEKPGEEKPSNCSQTSRDYTTDIIGIQFQTS